ncbi:MAG TPA: hypothetical protein VMB05_09350 [Solirubrobacteraceae bacterium]|nr:hypothetical protein [Solirubrobacteraceae bacterium]
MTVEIQATQLLRSGLLAGVSVVLAGANRGGAAPAIGTALAALGAEVSECELVCSGEPEADDARVQTALGQALGSSGGGAHALVVDAGAMFDRQSGLAATGAVGPGVTGPSAADARGLIAALEAAWRVTRAVANDAFIAPGTGGRIVYLAPATPPVGASPGAASAVAVAERAEAARTGLENLARTLSIEWARYGITPVSIAPGLSTSAEELAAVVAYLLSPAGAYFSGTELDLRGPGAAVGR